MRKKSFYESTETAINLLKKAFIAIAEEWKLVARNFTLIDEDEISIAVDMINNDIESLKNENAQDVVDSLASLSDLDIFDDIYVTDEDNKTKIVADCFLLNSVLTKEERIAIAYKKGNVAISGVRENGRDLLRISITL